MKKLFFFFIVGIILCVFIAEVTMGKDNIVKGDNPQYRIFFWGDSIKDMGELEKLTYVQCVKKIRPDKILSDDNIIRYYWDEQLIEYAYKKIKDKFDDRGSFFTIVLGDKIIYHGLNKVQSNILAKWHKYSGTDYPVIIEIPSSNPNNLILALKPKDDYNFGTLRDFEKKEHKKILNKDVLEYFKQQGKIVRGKIDFEAVTGLK
ncbi:hypothetical protein ACFL1N_17180 [Thermodesulfobacteriota bacterium]